MNSRLFLIYIIIFCGCAGIFFGIWLLIYGIFHARAMAVRRVAPGAMMQLGELNVASMRTFRDVFDMRHVPRILTWTFDSDNATLWGAHPKAGPVFTLAKTQTRGLLPIQVYSKGYYPGIAIKVLDPASGDERLIGWLVRDTDRPLFPKKQAGVGSDLETLRRLWGQENTYIDWNSDDISKI